MRLHLEMWPDGRNDQYGSWPMSAGMRDALLGMFGGRPFPPKGLTIKCEAVSDEGFKTGTSLDIELINRVLAEQGQATFYLAE